MDIRKIIDTAVELAKVVGPAVPVLANGIGIAEKLGQIFEDLKEEVPLEAQGELQVERNALALHVSAKVAAEVKALRGE